LVVLVGLIGLVGALLVPAAPAEAACAPHRSGDWIGTWAYSDLSGGGSSAGTVNFSGSTVTGVLTYITGVTGALTQQPLISASVDCNEVTLGDVAGVAFSGTFSPDGMQMTGTWTVGFASGVWSSSYVSQEFSDTATTLTSDTDGTGATVDQPVQTSITSPTEGELVIQHAVAPLTTVAGYQILSQVIHIEAPEATAAEPLSFTFELDGSVLNGATATNVAVLRNNVVLDDCVGNPGEATPDPCIAARVDLPNGNVSLTVLTSAASVWSFGVDPEAIDVPAFYAGSVTVIEGSGGKQRTLQIPVTLSEPQSTTVSVEYTVSNGSASGGSDFTPKPKGKVKFVPTASLGGLTPTSKFITLKVIGDNDPEPTENLVVTLRNPSPGMALGYAASASSILDDDGGVNPQVGVGDARVFEGDAGAARVVKLPVSRSDGTGSASVRYTVVAVEPTSSLDYTAKASGIIKFPIGAVQKPVTIKIVPDVDSEGDETLQVVLSDPSGVTIGRTPGTVTILDDD
jgi:hypothetical protein